MAMIHVMGASNNMLNVVFNSQCLNFAQISTALPASAILFPVTLPADFHFCSENYVNAEAANITWKQQAGFSSSSSSSSFSSSSSSFSRLHAHIATFSSLHQVRFIAEGIRLN